MSRRWSTTLVNVFTARAPSQSVASVARADEAAHSVLAVLITSTIVGGTLVNIGADILVQNVSWVAAAVVTARSVRTDLVASTSVVAALVDIDASSSRGEPVAGRAAAVEPTNLVVAYVTAAAIVGGTLVDVDAGAVGRAGELHTRPAGWLAGPREQRQEQQQEHTG